MADRRLLRAAGKIVLALALILSFAGVFQHELWTPDEPREAEVAREMLDSGFSAMPTLSGTLFVEKPPLFAWIQAATYSVFGVSAGAARLPAALFAVGAIFVAYLIGRRAAGRLAGICTAAVAATMWQFAETAHKGVLDVSLAFFVAAGHLAFLRLKDENRTRNYVAIGVLSGLAFLTKGIIGPGLMCAPPVLAAAALRDWGYVKRVLPRAAAASVAGVVAFGLPWVLALADTPGGGWRAVKVCLIDNTFGRTFGGKSGGYTFSGHDKWFGYYLPSVVQVTAPWVLAAPAWFKGGTLSRSWRGGRVAFCGILFVAGVLLLSIPSGKRGLYLVPLLPALAVVPGVWLSRIGTRRGGSWDRATCVVLQVLATGLFLAIAAGMAWLALGMPFWDGLEEHIRNALSSQSRTALVLMVATGIWVLGPHAWVMRRLIPRTARGARLAASVVTVFVIVHGAAMPLFDPVRSMDEGARRVGEIIPREEILLSFDADETTRAILPFYTGRLLEDRCGKDAGAEIEKELDAGTTRHLIVMEKDVEELPRRLRDRLELVEDVQASATRVIHVYALKR